MRKTLVPLVIALALFTPAAAAAATIGDLQALGYTVAVQFETPTCKALTVSGFGISTSLGCEGTPDFQAAVDSIANPAGHCNRKWQANHPDQLSALNGIVGKGYGVSGDQCADTYTVTNPNTGATVYSGAGAGLPSLDATVGPPAPAPPAPAGAAAPPPSSGGPRYCLPLCPTAPIAAPSAPAAPTTTSTAALATAAAVVAAPTPDKPVATSTYTVVVATPEITAESGIIGWVNTPYQSLPVTG